MFLRNILEEGEENWERLRSNEIKRIRLQDKEDRLRVVEMKKKKYGKKIVKKGESKEEKRRLDVEMKKKIELAEIRTNMWKLYRDRDGNFIEVSEKIKNRECRRRKLKKKEKERKKDEEKDDLELVAEAERFEEERRKKIEKANLMRGC